MKINEDQRISRECINMRGATTVAYLKQMVELLLLVTLMATRMRFPLEEKGV